MLQLWVIALLATVYMHDQLVQGAHYHVPAEPLELWRIGAALAPYLAIVLLTELVCWASAKQMDDRGSMRAVIAAERMLSASRWTAVVTHVLSVFVLGWVGQVRAVVGDQIMIDELIAIAPPLATIIAGWWSFYPIERRLRDAVWLRVLEDGEPAYPVQSQWQFVWTNIRHQLLFVLVPIGLMGCWSELMNRAGDWLIRRQDAEGFLGRVGRWMAHDSSAEAVRFLLQIAGVVTVFLFTPVIMRLVWDAIPLGPGPLRDRLLRVCERAGVPIRELLVWRTYGTMVNGAAMGLVAPLRYILLTDALLDRLPGRQVESVMAHEVGHAKHHHIPWLVLGMMGAMGLLGAGFAIALIVVAMVLPSMFHAIGVGKGMVVGQLVLELASLPVMLVCSIASFGWISRRFEWQADAFAAQQLSKDDPAGTVVTAEAVESMCGALGAVAQLSHIDPRQGSFRHGSIALRQAKLRALVGKPINRLPIDRLVRWIKGGIVVGIAALVLSLAAESFVTPPAPPEAVFRPEPYRRSWPQSQLENAP